ncbi:MAG: WD40 repeat domain-containing protein, partial [Bacteroidota bacterium]
LVTVSDDLNVFVYEAATDEIPERNLRGHEGWVKAVDWAPNNRAVATADQDGVIIVHQLKNGAQQFLNAYDEETSWEDLAFAPDSKQLAVLSSYELAVYNLSNPKEVSRCSPEQTLTSTVTGNDQADQANRLENTLNRLLPTAVSLYPDPTSDRLGIIDEAYQLNVINGESGEELFLIDGHEDWIRNIDWSTNGQLLATASDDMMVGVWSAETGEMQHLLAGHTDWVRDVAFSPDNKVLASASDDGIIRIWDPEAGDELASTDKLDVFLMTVDWSPGQSYFASQSNDNSIHVWSAKNNELLHSFYEATSTGTLKWTDDNTFTVIGSEGGRFVWDGGEELATTDGAAIRSNSEQGTSATANGPYITVSGNGEEVFLAGHRSDIVQLDWSPDGTYLVSQAADGQLGIWTPSTSSAAHALLNLSDGIGKPLIWSKDGAGFYTTGASNKVLLPTDRLRLSASDTKAALSGEDILRFGLESTLLTDPAVVERLQASAPAEFLRAVADFYAARADAKGEATGQADAAKAAAFRAAADR